MVSSDAESSGTTDPANGPGQGSNKGPGEAQPGSWPIDAYGRPWPADRQGRPWPVDIYGRPWPADQYGRPWPADPYGNPVSPYLPGPAPGSMAMAPGIDTPSDLRLYRGSPATLVEAVAAEQAGGTAVKVASWGLWDILITLCLWLFLGILAAFGVAATAHSGPMAKGAAMIVGVTLPWAALLGWPTLVTKLRGNGPFIDLGLRWRWSDIGWGLVYGIVSLTVGIILGIVTTILFGEFDSAAGELANDLASEKIVFLLFLLTVVLGAPIVEEFFFRGYIFAAVAKKGWGPVWALAISAILFSLIHFEPKRILVLLGIGIVLSVARWVTGSVTTSIVAHMFNNLVSSIGLFVMLFG